MRPTRLARHVALYSLVVVVSAASAEDRRSRSAESAGKNEDPAIVVREFLYESAPFPSCHATTIEETPNGLVAAFFGGTMEGNRDVTIWVCRHLNGKWTAPVEVANGVQHKSLRHPCWNPVLFQHPNGPLQLYYKVGPSPSTWWGMLTESTDHGETWSWPRRLPEQIDGPVRNKPVLLENGDLLCGSSIEYDGWLVHFEITADRGRTWERIGPVNRKEEFNAIQPTILTHSDGRLQALCRTQEGRISSTWSTDQGRTWSKMTATTLPNPNSGIDAVTLKDGRHLLVYNHTLRNAGTPRRRDMLNLAVTEDGETWQAALIIEQGQGEFSYPAVIQTSDGLAHITYTWRRKLLRHVVVDPSQLELTPIVDGRWPGLPQAGVDSSEGR
jgi:predicted neuraminidase